nr:MAG TPA: hypothetical protein [Caudoviricetes sp.]
MAKYSRCIREKIKSGGASLPAVKLSRGMRTVLN